MPVERTCVGDNMADPLIYGDGSTDYEKYIRTQELYRLQKGTKEWANEEELLFQSIHQAMELWLKVVIQHLEQSVAWVKADKLRDATRFIKRTASMIEFLGDSLKFPMSIAPWDYHKIRMGLGKGSGQESPGFNKLLEQPEKLWEAYAATLKRHKKTIDEVHQDPHGLPDLFELTIAMSELDQELMHWRYRHFQLVKRIIGDAVMSLKGIPASALEKNGNMAFFPEIWAVINRTTNAYNQKYRPQGGGAY